LTSQVVNRKLTPPSGSFLWRVMAHGGLQSGETPLVTEFEQGFESVQKHN
jgi:hypothetical protein